MERITVNMQRWSIVSPRPFQDVVASIESQLGRPDVNQFFEHAGAAEHVEQVAAIIAAALGGHELMEFARFNVGTLLKVERGPGAPRGLRVLVGNPFLVKAMAKRVPDAAAYVPATVLIDERADGVHLSFDTFVSLLAPYRNAEASAIAAQLDAKIEALLTAAV